MSVEKRVGARAVTWRVRWHEGGRQRSRGGFATRRAAQDFEAARRALAASGGTVPTRAEAAMSVAEQYRAFIASQPHLAPTTRASYESLWRVHVDAEWGLRRLIDVRQEDVQRWVAALSRRRRPSTVRHAHRLLSLVLASAVRAGRLPANPAVGVSLPRLSRSERPAAITIEQVEALAAASGDWWGPWVRWQAYTGMRLGETSALRVRDVDLIGRRVHVVRNLVSVHGRLVEKPPKSHQARVVPVPGVLLDQLAARCAGKAPDDRVWTLPDGAWVSRDRLRASLGWHRLVRDTDSIPADLRIHDLRHSAASLMLSQGASALDVSRILGHHSAAFTLSVYGHVLDGGLQAAADRLDAEVRRRSGRNSGGEADV